MDEIGCPRGKQVYIHGDIMVLVEEYAERNRIPLSKAVNELLSDRLRKDDNRPATVKDVKKILKRIELLSAMFEPTILDIIEASSKGAYEANRDIEKVQFGREVKQKYSKLFGELREML